MITLNKQQVIYQLNSLLTKINDYRDNPNLEPQFNIGERHALIEAINFLKNENNDASHINKIKEEYNKKLQTGIQSYCDHHWGPVVWQWSCGGYRECIKCGARENYYERD